MKLFHGSDMIVKRPLIMERLRALDFGAGFYLTSSKQQAIRWARVVARRRVNSTPVLNSYYFSDDFKNSGLRILEFDTASIEWLDFVVLNRKLLISNHQYDLVIGPVADDTTIRVIDDYIDGKYDREEAIKRLLPQNLTDQYAFITEKALKLLKFEGSEII